MPGLEFFSGTSLISTSVVRIIAAMLAAFSTRAADDLGRLDGDYSYVPIELFLSGRDPWLMDIWFVMATINVHIAASPRPGLEQ
jgi:hypothetical protein